MILTQEEINRLGDEWGFGTLFGSEDDYSKEMIWYDGNPTNLIRAVEKLILEKLDNGQK